MPTKQLITEFNKIKTILPALIEKKVLAAAYQLGNFYYTLDTIDEKNENLFAFKIEIAEYLQSLTETQIKNLWKAVNPPSHEWRLLDAGNKKSLLALKMQMIRNTFFLKYIDNLDLINQGNNNIQLYREIFIALIRKYLLFKGKNDPFHCERFSYKLLQQAGSECNFLYLSSFIKKCDTLPLEDITLLCNEDSKIAELILTDLRDTPYYFKFGVRFIKLFPALREKIAQEWGGYIENYPLEEETTIDSCLQETKLYPEFENIDLKNRAIRFYKTHLEMNISSKLNIIYKGLAVPAIACWTPYLYAHAYNIVQLAGNFFPAHWDPKLRIPRGQVVAAASIVSPKY